MTRGVVYAEPDAAPAVEELTVDPPGPREVLVRVHACGLCHSDLHVVETEGLGHAASRSCSGTRAPGSSRRSGAT